MAGTLIVALDVDSRREAESLVSALDGTADFFKIGYQLFYGGDGFALGKELLAELGTELRQPPRASCARPVNSTTG